MLKDYVKRVIFCLLLAQSISAVEFVEGRHYLRMTDKQRRNPEIVQIIEESPTDIQVVEFFSFACYWCYRMHDKLDDWVVDNKPDNVGFMRVPVIFQRGWDILGKAYYVGEVLDKSKAIDHALFKALHEDNINIGNLSKLEAIFSENGISSKEFNSIFYSFSIDRMIKRADDISRAYRITATPSVAVNSEQAVFGSNPSMAGGEKEFLELIDYLVKLQLSLVNK